MKRRIVKNGVSIEIDREKVDFLLNAIGHKFETRVGVLGKKTSRKDKLPITNAGIGLVHEKGSRTRNIPRRSFLVDTFFFQGNRLISIKQHLAHWFMSGEYSAERLKKIYTLLGIHAENLVQKAFETGGFGKWKALSKTTIARKKSSAILIDTAQLRRSITSDVVAK